MKFTNPYPMPRLPVVSKRGMVATSQPTAAQAGISILERGGNAIDAAIATAAALTVVEPTSNGLGGDAFALIWSQDQLYGLNGSGPSPRRISRQAMVERGHQKMPMLGWEPVNVPGAIGLWSALNAKLGRLSLAEILEPAIKLAERGYAVPPVLALNWQRAYRHYQKSLSGSEFQNWFKTFAPQGRVPEVLESWSSSEMARTLRLIAESNGESFYRGELAQRIIDYSDQYGGFLGLEDLADFQAEWVAPISTSYRGHEIWELPPNGQGIAVLMALQILNQENSVRRDDERSVHRMIEAVKLAMSDSAHYVTDIKKMKVSPEQMISSSYAQKRWHLIGDEALEPYRGEIDSGGTVYLAVADDQGNFVSFIQSNYEGFGSALVVPETGIALQNRGANFSLDPTHHNVIEGNKKTFHTIIPGFITRQGAPVAPFGVMGDFNQVQGHVQVVSNLLDNQLNPQAALDAPRWRWIGEKSIVVESHFPRHIISALQARGHSVEIAVDSSRFGRGQVIWYDREQGAFIGGTESRTDSLISVL